MCILTSIKLSVIQRWTLLKPMELSSQKQKKRYSTGSGNVTILEIGTESSKYLPCCNAVIICYLYIYIFKTSLFKLPIHHVDCHGYWMKVNSFWYQCILIVLKILQEHLDIFWLVLPDWSYFQFFLFSYGGHLYSHPCQILLHRIIYVL